MYFVHACVEELQILSEWKYIYLVHACVMELQSSELGEVGILCARLFRGTAVF